MKSLYIAEKPSVAMEFASALGVDKRKSRQNGYLEDDQNIITWCVGHLIEMSYPEKYDPELKKWRMEDLPFLPRNYRYEVIPTSKDQYQIVAKLLNRNDVAKIYYSGDSAREGEYIQRLVRQEAGRNPNAEEYRVWIDSQTKDEILRGIREAKLLSAYDTLSDSAYARAIEDYLIGINFSRVLSLRYANLASRAVGGKYHSIAVGRVMSCVLGMIVERERLIRNTKTISFYSMKAEVDGLVLDWKIAENSRYFGTPDNYNNIGLLNKKPVDELLAECNQTGMIQIVENEKSTAKKSAPLLFNLAELQAECTKQFKISPAEALAIAQSLYEKKLTTYPRTDARVLTTAITKVYGENIRGLMSVPGVEEFAATILEKNLYNPARMDQTKYVDDTKVSDHYAIIPTGQGLNQYAELTELEQQVYLLICRRFLSIFYPAATIEKVNITGTCQGEQFNASFSYTANPGYLVIAGYKEKPEEKIDYQKAISLSGTQAARFVGHEGKSKPPARYTSGSMMLAMENAGNLIEDEELREQIKNSGIGTSATRGEVIAKLERNQYIKINKKTQVITPDCLGEIIYDILKEALPHILNPQYTASWEKGLQGIVDGTVTKEHYLSKIDAYVLAGVKEMKEKDFTERIKSEIQSLRSVYPSIQNVDEAVGGTKPGTGLTCPICGSPIMKGDKSYYCGGYKNGCKFSVWTKISGKTITDGIVKELIANWKPDGNGGGSAITKEEVKGFVSKAGKKYSARLQVSAAPGEYAKIQMVF